MRTNKLFILAAGLACAAVLAGCPHRGEGPAERVGKGMDKGVQAVGHGIEKTGDAIENTAGGK